MPSNLSPFFVLSERERTAADLTIQFKPTDAATKSLEGFYPSSISWITPRASQVGCGQTLSESAACQTDR